MAPFTLLPCTLPEASIDADLHLLPCTLPEASIDADLHLLGKKDPGH